MSSIAELLHQEWLQQVEATTVSIIAQHGVKCMAQARMGKLLEFWSQNTPSLLQQRSKNNVQLAQQLKVQRFAVDFCLTTEHQVILMEVDENQHAHYEVEKDAKRTNTVLNELRRTLEEVGTPELPIYLFRFNPHPFRVQGKSCPLDIDQRELLLLEYLEQLLRKATHHIFNVIYCFYDTDENGYPTLWSQPEFPKTLLPWCYPLCTQIELSKGRVHVTDGVAPKRPSLFTPTRTPIKDVKLSDSHLERVKKQVEEGRKKREMKIERKRARIHFRDVGGINIVSGSFRIHYKDSDGAFKSKCLTIMTRNELGRKVMRPIRELIDAAKRLGLSAKVIDRNLKKLRLKGHLE